MKPRAPNQVGGPAKRQTRSTSLDLCRSSLGFCVVAEANFVDPPGYAGSKDGKHDVRLIKIKAKGWRRQGVFEWALRHSARSRTPSAARPIKCGAHDKMATCGGDRPGARRDVEVTGQANEKQRKLEVEVLRR